MEGAEFDSLYQRFARPLHEHPALSAAAEDVRDRLCRHLWLAMIAGPSAEEEAREVFASAYGLRPDHVEMICQCYCRCMRPQINEEQLRTLRARYRDGE